MYREIDIDQFNSSQHLVASQDWYLMPENLNLSFPDKYAVNLYLLMIRTIVYNLDFQLSDNQPGLIAQKNIYHL